MNVVRDVLGQLFKFYDAISKPIGLHEPELTQDEENLVLSCVRSGWVSSVGEFVNRFESDLAQYCGTEAVVATCNGTSALHLALLSVGVKADDDVIAPAVSFVATVNAIRHCFAHPVFVDIEPNQLAMCPKKLAEFLREETYRDGQVRRNRRTDRVIRAAVCVHVLGIPAGSASLKQVLDEFQIPLVEDAAEAIGSIDQSAHAGTTGILGVLSFNGNKLITTGGGGAVLCSREMGAKIKHLSTQSKISHPWEFEHDDVGYNYRMPNINAALGCAQLSRIEAMLERKRRLGSVLRESVCHESLDWPGATLGKKWNHWLLSMRISGLEGQLRQEVFDSLHLAGIQARPLWKPLPMLKPYGGCVPTAFPEAYKAWNEIVCLPSSAGLVPSGGAS